MANADKNKQLEIFPMFYKFLHIASSVDYGFITFETRKMKYITNSILIFQVVCFSVACMIQTLVDETWFTIRRHALHLVQYLLYVCFSMIMDRDATLAGCLSVFRNVDIKLHLDIRSYNLKAKNLSAVFVFLLMKIAKTSVVCGLYGMCLTGFFKNMFYFWLAVNKDVLVVQNIFVFYVIECRLEKLIRILEIDNIQIVSCHRVYKMISDITFRLKRGYDFVFTTTLFFNVVQTMGFIYFGVMEIKNTKNTNLTVWDIILGAEQLVIVSFLLSTFLPPFFAGKLSSQAENIINILHDKLLDCQDTYEARNIKKFIRYVEANPLKFTVFKVIPLDASLIGMVVGFCITYLIVIIQLTHLY